MALAGWQPLKPSDDIAPGESYADGAWKDLRAALDIDRNLPAARRLLISLLVAGGDRLLRADQRIALAREIHRSEPDPDALLVYGRFLRTQREYDSALAVFSRAADLGGDRSRLDLERARTLRAMHDTAGASAAYWTGLEHLSPAGREMYRYDLAWIVDSDSLASFDRTPTDSIPAWIRRFWDERDAVSANHAGERLDEHLRRWALVYARYRARSPWRRAMYDRIDMFFDNNDCVHMDLGLYRLLWRLQPAHDGDPRAREWLLDQRGMLYLRHGEPLQVFGIGSERQNPEDFVNGPPADTPDTTPVWSPWAMGSPVMTFLAAPESFAGVPYQASPHYSESWLYLIEGQYRLLHFRDSYAIGMYGATTMASALAYSPSEWLAVSGTLPEYHAAGERIASEARFKYHSLRDPPTCWNQVRTATARSRADADVAGRNDSDSPPVSYPWQSVTQLFALGDGRDHTGEILVTFAVGGDSLKAETAPDGRVLYAIHFRVAAWNKASGQTVVLDTTRRFLHNAPLTPAERLVAWLELPLENGDWEVGVRAMQQSRSTGAFAMRRDLHVSGGKAVSLSDIVTGRRGSPPWHATDGADFPVDATGAWVADSPAELYYEVRGVPPNESYRTTITVRPLDSKNARTIRLSTVDRASADVTYVRRSIGMEQLLPGRYELTVTVERGSERATRVQDLVIVPAH